MAKILIVDDSTILRDLVITDINPPKKNGFELIGILRATEEYATIPILTLTTEQTNEMKAKGKTAGAAGWIVKPFMPDQLLQAVKL